MNDARFSRLGRAARGTAIMLALAATAGCLAPIGEAPFFATTPGSEAIESQLAGEALAQRKYSMRRVRRDLSRFRTTLEQLQRHGKAEGTTRFEAFVRPFLASRVEPLVEHDGAVSHVELRPFHAELLLSKAVLLHQMGDRRELLETIDRLTAEFAAIDSMLVLYPTGEAVTLAQGIHLLRQQTGAL